MVFLSIEQFEKNQFVAIHENGSSLSYGELIEFCEEITKILPSRTLVFSFCKNTIGSLAGYVAFLSAQVVPLLLSCSLEKESMLYLMDTYKPNYLWIPVEQKNRFDGKCIYEKFDYVLIQCSTSKIDLYKDLALLLTTSGSTGSPKLVRQSYLNIEENAKSIATYLELDQTERPITTLPMNYTYGLSIINSHLLVGATLLMTETSYAQRGFWDFFRKEKATSFAGVPYTYEMLKRIHFFRMELPSLRYLTQAGGKLIPELHKEFAEYAQKNQKRFYVMYGQTEATARMSYLPYQKSLEKYGSMGIAIPGGKFYLRDMDGSKVVHSHTTGELIYEGPNVTLGYAECIQDLSKGDEREGVLATGDMAQYDKDGYYYIVGRKKRFLKIYGNRINLDESERMIQEKFKELECACVGVDDNMRIYITEEKYLKDVKDFIIEKTNLNSRAFETVYIGEIPKNEAGKKQYQLLNK